MRRDARFAASLLLEAAGMATPRGRLLASGVLAALLGALGPGRLERGPVLCLYRRLTGQACPACGMTRAVAALMRGQPRRAAHCNKLAFPLVLIMLAILAGDVHKIVTRISTN